MRREEHFMNNKNRKIVKCNTLFAIKKRIAQEELRGWRQISDIKFFQCFGGVYQVLMEFENNCTRGKMNAI